MILQALTMFSVLALALGGPSHCDPTYQCMYLEELPSGEIMKWDFRDLCSATEYKFYDKNTGLANLSYAFNFCGTTTSSCYPSEFSNPYPQGTAIQFWNWAPSCPPAEKKCQDPSGNAVCCTMDCVTLGLGSPRFHPIDITDSKAGINISHAIVPADDRDPFECPYDPKTGNFLSRSITYMMKCDPKGKKGIFEVEKVVESPQCQYTMIMTSIHGCGSIYQCPSTSK